MKKKPLRIKLLLTLILALVLIFTLGLNYKRHESLIASPSCDLDCGFSPYDYVRHDDKGLPFIARKSTRTPTYLDDNITQIYVEKNTLVGTMVAANIAVWAAFAAIVVLGGDKLVRKYAHTRH